MWMTNFMNKFKQKKGTMSFSEKRRIVKYLDEEGIPYRLISHSEVFGASRLAQSIHVPGREVAKVVIVRMGGPYAMVVIPSHRPLDLIHFGEAIGRKDLSLAEEKDLEMLFP
ncbi:MAG: YbaK/EbsC family protein, partial [Candidatus Manganitrophaceae bacterium]